MGCLLFQKSQLLFAMPIETIRVHTLTPYFLYTHSRISLRADSHYTSGFRSVAERHRSVKFSHVQ